MTTGSTPEYEKKGFKPPEFYEAAGNRFAIFINPNTNEKDIADRAAKVFEQNPGTIDTVLVLVRLDAQVPTFQYLVIERDGSWSEMCGNGARAVARFLYESGLVEPDEPIILNTKSNRQIIVQPVKIDGETWYQVNMGQVSSVEENQEPFQGLLGEGFDGDLEKFGLAVGGNLEKSGLEKLILRELNKYLGNPNLLRELFPNVKKDDEPKEDGEQKKTVGRILCLYTATIFTKFFKGLIRKVNLENLSRL